MLDGRPQPTRDVDSQGIKRRGSADQDRRRHVTTAPLGIEQTLHGPRREGVGCDAVDRVGREDDEVAVFERALCLQQPFVEGCVITAVEEHPLIVCPTQNQLSSCSKNAMAKNCSRRPMNTMVRKSHCGCLEAPASNVTIASGGMPSNDEANAVSPPA